MSLDQAREFVKRVKNEPDLLKQAASFKSKEERRQWAQGLRYDFTGEELEQASAELTDEELELVAGGNCCGVGENPQVPDDFGQCSWDNF